MGKLKIFYFETIRLKKTIWRLSRNILAFEEKETVMGNYISMAEKQIDEDNAVIVIDNSDITKPCSPKMEAISDVRDGSSGEIKKGYCTVEAAVLSKGKKMPLSVYEKVFLLLKRALTEMNIMDVANEYKGNYRMDFMDKHGKGMF